jgi:hypothetical protein
VIGLIAVLLAGCGPNPNPQGVTDTGTIVGNLVDARTNQPIGYATLAVGTIVQQLTPNNNGQVLLQGVPTGTQTVHINSSGYQSIDVQVVVRKDQTSQLGPSGTYGLQPTSPQ